MSTADRHARPVWPLLAWAALAIAGGVVWSSCLRDDGARAWRALLSNFLFFTSLAGGLVAWPAVVRGCNGKWHAGLERIAAGAISFSVPSILSLVALWAGSGRWSPWYGRIHHQGWWLDNRFVLGRNVALLVIFWGTAAWYLYRRRQGLAPRAGGILILAHSLVFSLIGMDLVMGLDPEWWSTLAGGYFFISAFYIGITAWAFLAVWHPQARTEQLKDLGRLMVAFSLMTTYLMYAHLNLIWYENLPHEVRFIVPRMSFEPGKAVSYLLLAVVYFGPLVLLLTERSKGNRWSLGAISLLVLAGLWLERWWLVAPTFNPAERPGVEALAAAALFLGIFALCLKLFDRSTPQEFLRGEE